MRADALCLAAALSLGACAPSLRTSATQPVVAERLSFGRNIGTRPGVTDSAWAAFLRDEVTPRFPAGFTVFRTEGQYRDSTGTIIHEAGFVLELVHPASRQADSSVVQIIERYKQLFQQESVLRVVIPAKARF